MRTNFDKLQLVNYRFVVAQRINIVVVVVVIVVVSVVIIVVVLRPRPCIE